MLLWENLKEKIKEEGRRGTSIHQRHNDLIKLAA